MGNSSILRHQQKNRVGDELGKKNCKGVADGQPQRTERIVILLSQKTRLKHQRRGKQKRQATEARARSGRDSLTDGSKVKLNSTTIVRMKTTVVVRSSRERNSVRSSLPSSTAVLESSAFTRSQKPGSSESSRLCVCRPPPIRHPVYRPCCQIGDFRLAVQAHQDRAAESLKSFNVRANQLTPCGSSPVAGSSSRITAGSFKAPGQSRHAAASREKRCAPTSYAAPPGQLPGVAS